MSLLDALSSLEVEARLVLKCRMTRVAPYLGFGDEESKNFLFEVVGSPVIQDSTSRLGSCANFADLSLSLPSSCSCRLCLDQGAHFASGSGRGHEKERLKIHSRTFVLRFQPLDSYLFFLHYSICSRVFYVWFQDFSKSIGFEDHSLDYHDRLLEFYSLRTSGA